MADTAHSDASSIRAVTVIGRVTVEDYRFAVVVDEPFRDGLRGLADFGHVIVTWWADRAERPAPGDRLVLDETPYVDGPDGVGVFTTRSPSRPTPIGISVAAIVAVDEGAGRLDLGWIDAIDDTPVVDIKPYFPSSDRVRDHRLPAWCASWPSHLEDSATFDWESVIAPD